MKDYRITKEQWEKFEASHLEEFKLLREAEDDENIDWTHTEYKLFQNLQRFGNFCRGFGSFPTLQRSKFFSKEVFEYLTNNYRSSDNSAASVLVKLIWDFAKEINPTDPFSLFLGKREVDRGEMSSDGSSWEELLINGDIIELKGQLMSFSDIWENYKIYGKLCYIQRDPDNREMLPEDKECYLEQLEETSPEKFQSYQQKEKEVKERQEEAVRKFQSGLKEGRYVPLLEQILRLVTLTSSKKGERYYFDANDPEDALSTLNYPYFIEWMNENLSKEDKEAFYNIKLPGCGLINQKTNKVVEDVGDLIKAVQDGLCSTVASNPLIDHLLKNLPLNSRDFDNLNLNIPSLVKQLREINPDIKLSKDDETAEKNLENLLKNNFQRVKEKLSINSDRRDINPISNTVIRNVERYTDFDMMKTRLLFYQLGKAGKNDILFGFFYGKGQSKKEKLRTADLVARNFHIFMEGMSEIVSASPDQYLVLREEKEKTLISALLQAATSSNSHTDAMRTGSLHEIIKDIMGLMTCNFEEKNELNTLITNSIEERSAQPGASRSLQR